MGDEPTVFVVDDHPETRESLRWLLQSVGLAAEAYGSAEEFLANYSVDRPGCLLLDVRMPGMGGLGLQRELAAREITLPIIFISGHGNVPIAARAFKAGAFDFVEKPFSDETLLEQVQRALRVDQQERSMRKKHAEVLERLARLTQRQRQVVDELLAGKANKVIAEALGVSERTVEVHRAEVMKRLEVDSLAALVQLVAFARGNQTDGSS